MPKAAISAVPKRSFASRSKSACLLRVGGREAGFDQVDAEVVERVRDAHLLVDRERHALALHAIAQGRVIDGDGHACGRHRHEVEPVRVAGVAAAQRVLEHALDLARDRAGRADLDVVDLAHRRELGGGAGEEDLVGQRQLGAGDVALDDLVAEVARDLDARLAVDAVEDRVRLAAAC